MFGLSQRRHHHLVEQRGTDGRRPVHVLGGAGGYELAREQRRITADDILRAAGTAEDMDGAPAAGSTLLNKVVMPALGQAEHAFSDALARINVEDLAHSAAALRKSAGEG